MAVFVLLTVVVTWPLVVKLTVSVPGDLGIPLFIGWAMRWVGERVSAALVNPFSLRVFWDAPIFYPEPGALALSEHFIPQTLWSLPAYWLTQNPILCYNLAFLLSYVLTGTGTALLTRALTGNLLAGVLAGVVAAFNEYRLVWEVAHLQTLSIYWFPFVLLGAHRYLATGSRRSLAGAAIAWICIEPLLGLSTSPTVRLSSLCSPWSSYADWADGVTRACGETWQSLVLSSPC